MDFFGGFALDGGGFLLNGCFLHFLLYYSKCLVEKSKKQLTSKKPCASVNNVVTHGTCKEKKIAEF